MSSEFWGMYMLSVELWSLEVFEAQGMGNVTLGQQALWKYNQDEIMVNYDML